MATPQRQASASRNGQCNNQQIKQVAPAPAEAVGKTPMTRVSDSAESKKGMQTRSRGASAGAGAHQPLSKGENKDSDSILQDYKQILPLKRPRDDDFSSRQGQALSSRESVLNSNKRRLVKQASKESKENSTTPEANPTTPAAHQKATPGSVTTSNAPSQSIKNSQVRTRHQTSTAPSSNNANLKSLR